ncbi:hypothetical protein [Escherichia coli]|uniref:hypothetical protein n=1 Tax=Escherichia coli TaxID=562 RepID=UPI001F392D1D|nr:hypothetical protein [Escherichia coli]MCF7419275.1 hypothetical protein [Escherichia coli]
MWLMKTLLTSGCTNQRGAGHVNSTYTASQAAEIVRKSMDADDKLIVVDASNNVASWFNLSAEVANFIKEQWPK